MKNIAVFASGRGSNFSSIVQAARIGAIKARISLMISDNPDAPVLKKARSASIKTALVERKDFPNKEKFEAAIIQLLQKEKIDLIVLAGFMRVLSPGFVRKYKNRILNIHPSLLPSFKGAHGIKDAYSYGVKITGVTVHFVDEKIDHGPIILQAAVEIDKNDTLESLEEKIHKLEHKLYPSAIQLYCASKLRVEGNKVMIRA